jgi:hypothetical protein
MVPTFSLPGFTSTWTKRGPLSSPMASSSSSLEQALLVLLMPEARARSSRSTWE